MKYLGFFPMAVPVELYYVIDIFMLPAWHKFLLLITELEFSFRKPPLPNFQLPYFW